MAELRIHDQSSIYFKSIRTGTTTKDIDVKIPDKSGTLITDTTLQDILNRGGRFSASQILKPDITETPLEHPEAYSKLLPIASYRTSDTFVGEHTATEWVASEQPDFSIILDSTSDSLFRDGWYPAVNRPSVPVYVKYRFISEDVCSPYSDALEFTTPTGGVKIPTLSVVEDGVTPTVKGSPFALYGDATGINHVSSSWEIYRVRDNKLIKSITQDSSKLTEYKVEAGLLDSDTEYKFVLTYHTDHPVFSRTRKALGIYKTPESSIKTPTLSFSSDNNKYLIIGTPFVVNSGTDEHKFTAWEVKNATDAVVYTEPNSRDLTTLNLTGVLEPDSSYTVTAVYKGAKASSAKAVLTFRTPVETIDNLNKKITLTRLSDGGVELKMDKVQLATAEKLLYLTWTVQNYEKKVALEVRLDKDLDTKYGQDLIYTMTPTESWLKWFPNLEAVNPTLKLSAKGRVVGEKTILNYSTSAPFEYKPKIALGEMSVAGHTESLTPLVSITAHSGEDLSWITVTNATWELWKLQEGLNPVKVKSVDSNDLLKNRYNGLDYNTNYRATVVYNTNFGKYSKSIEFKSADIFLPRPNVIVESKGNTILIKVNNPDRTIPGKPEKSHGSTTWILYSNTGDTLWKSEKNTTNLTEITLPTGLLQGTTNYKVGVIFHSRDGLLSSNEGQATYYHRGIEIIEGYTASGIGPRYGLKAMNQRYEFKDYKVYEGGVESTTERIVSGKLKSWWSNNISKIGYYTTRNDAFIQEEETEVNTTTSFNSITNALGLHVQSLTLRTTSSIEKQFTNNIGVHMVPSPYGIYHSRYYNKYIDGNIERRYVDGGLIEITDAPSTANNQIPTSYIFFHGDPVPQITYTGTESIPSNWADNNVISINPYAPLKPNYKPLVYINGQLGNITGGTYYFTLHKEVNSGRGDMNNGIFYGFVYNTSTEHVNTPSNLFNLLARYYYSLHTKAIQETGNSTVESVLELSGLMFFNKEYTINSTHKKVPAIDIIQYSPALLIYNDTERKFTNAAMVSPTTKEYCYVSTDSDMVRNGIANTYFVKYEMDNLDQYFYYYNNIIGLDYPVNGMPYNIRFSTEDEIKEFFSAGTSTSTGTYGSLITNLFNKDAKIYYLQDNASLTGTVKALKPRKVGSDIVFSKVDVTIHDCIVMYTITPRNPVLSNTGDNSILAYDKSEFKIRYPNVLKFEEIVPQGVENGEIHVAHNMQSMSGNGPKYWSHSLLNVNTAITNYDLIKGLYFSWLTGAGYMRTIPATEFKSLSEIRTILGLTPTNAQLNPGDLTEWYMMYWRGRIFYIPNAPIATTNENVLTKWKTLYELPGKPTTSLLAIDKKSDQNLYKLTIPTYTDISTFKGLNIKQKLYSADMNKYTKHGRIAPIGWELGDIINPDIIKETNPYDTEILNKLKSVYDKLNDNVILPFFELPPKQAFNMSNRYYGFSYLGPIHYGAFFIYENGAGINKRLRFKIILGTNDKNDTLTYKIDKVVVKFTSSFIEGGSKTIETTDISYTTTSRPASGKLKLYAKSISGPYNIYEGTILKNASDSDYPVFTSAYTGDGLNNTQITHIMETYVHITEPNDCFIYLYTHIGTFADIRGQQVAGDVIGFKDLTKTPRETPLATATIETDITKNYNPINNNNNMSGDITTGMITYDRVSKTFSHFVTM